MLRRAALILALCLVLAAPAWAERSVDDLIGRWQGVAHLDRDMRVVLIIAKDPDGQVKGRAYLIDQAPGPGGVIRDISVSGDAVKMSILGGAYQGTLSKDGRVIEGSYDFGFPSPIKFARVSGRAGWDMPLPEDKQPHKVQFIPVGMDTKVEVLDWGGEGRPLLFLSGLNGDAHAFDKFAPLFTKNHHVYGMTRRGVGASDKPEPTLANYDNALLGDDVLAVMDALKIDRAILAGWSYGGAEISSVATRHPERVAAAIFLDAGYAYTFYAPGNLIPWNINVIGDAADLREKLLTIADPDRTPLEASEMIDRVLKTDIPQLQADLLAVQARLREMPSPPPPANPPVAKSLSDRIQNAIRSGSKKYPALPVPVLAFYATEQKPIPGAPQAQLDQTKRFAQLTDETVRRFEAGNPNAKVIRIPNGTHDLFHSDEKIVVREMKAFMASLP